MGIHPSMVTFWDFPLKSKVRFGPRDVRRSAPIAVIALSRPSSMYSRPGPT